MKIIAGLGYDNRLPNKLPQQLGVQLCGERGLIDMLAFRAGISPHPDSKAKRTVAYLKALKAADDGNRFYSSSLEVDPLSSAETLLHWRDWAMLHGWKHDEGSSDHERMLDLAAAEELFSEAPASIGERIYQIFPLLSTVATSIDEVILHHLRSSWSPLFQQLFNNMEKAGISVVEKPVNQIPTAPDETDLGKLQHALANGDTTSLKLSNDGTLRLFFTANIQLAALFTVREATPESLVIAQDHHQCLETAIVQSTNVSTGLGDLSSSRAPNQLLHLSLQCAWQTPSPDAVLQYLSLPAGKYQRLRRTLAKHFKDLPGHDVAGWECIIDGFIKKKLTDDQTVDESQLRQSIDEWLPVSICDNEDMMAIEDAVTITDRVAKYWQVISCSTVKDKSKEVFIAAYNAADAASLALRDWPDQAISKAQLNRLISMVRKIGQSQWREDRAVTPIDVVKDPEAAALRLGEIDHVIWIDPQIELDASIPPFSAGELAGIPLAPSDEQQAEFKRQALARAYGTLLCAKRSATLIAINTSPDLMKLQLSELTESEVWPSLEDAVLTNQVSINPTLPVSDVVMPQPHRWWDIETAVPALRKSESFSSLSSLSLKPHEYTLKYPARISEGSISSVAVDARLKGNLAHKVVETWIIEHPWTGEQIDRQAIASWLEKKLPTLIRQIALPLAQPGKNVERLQFKQQMLDAMDALLKAFAAANVAALHPELRLDHDDTIGHLEGTMDIFCEFADGRFAIIDMKWGGYTKYSNELKAGRPLQLATYAHIAEGKRPTKLADAGYFILSRAELLCNHSMVFPTATVVEPDTPTSLRQTWAQFERTVCWRIEQLHSGRIEIPYGNAEPDESSNPPLDALPLLDIEDSEQRSRRNTYRQTYKVVDVWRNLTGNIKD